MKTTAKLSLLAAAFLLMIAGCANNFTPTEPSKDSFAKNVEDKNAQTSKPLTTSGFSTPRKYSNGSDYLVTLTFSHPVDLSSIKTAVTFYKLKGNIPTTEKPQKEDTKIVFDVLDDVNSKDVSQVHFKLKNVDKVKVYAYVTGSAVKAAVTDQKMDQDEDKKQGEPVDDDYGKILNVGIVTGDWGNTDYLNMGASNTRISKTLPFSISSISFETARKADNFGKEADPEGGTLVTHITVGNTKTGDKYASETSCGIKYSDFESLLKNHVIVEQVGTKDGTGWEKVDTSFSYVSEDGHPYKGKFVSAITVKPETMLRVRFKDIQKIEVRSDHYEYQLKYTTNAHASDALAMETSKLLLEKDNSGKKVMFSATLPASNLKAKKGTNKTVTLTYTVPSKFENAVFANKAARDVKLMTKDGYIIGEYKGFDTSSLKKENFKLIGNNISGTAVNTYTAKRAYSANGITATLSVRKSGSASGGTAVLRDITALGNSTERSSSEKYYADVTNTVTFAYDVVYTNNGAVSAEGFYDDLNSLYNLAKSDTTVYTTNDLTKVFCTTVKSENMLISEPDILSFIHGAVGDVLGKGKDDFVANGQVTTDIPEVQSPLYLYLYLSPAVKTHSFKGMYNNGKEDVINYPIPAFSFAKVQPTSQDKFEREDGWLRLAVN